MNSYTFSDGDAFCPYRLPCGYCEKLGRDCPKMVVTVNFNQGTAATE